MEQQILVHSEHRVIVINTHSQAHKTAQCTITSKRKAFDIYSIMILNGSKFLSRLETKSLLSHKIYQASVFFPLTPTSEPLFSLVYGTVFPTVLVTTGNFRRSSG
jgi:hypothetical protein